MEFYGLLLFFFQATFIVATFVQVAFWIIVYARFVFFQDKKNEPLDAKTALPSVSVIICAKNEEKNLLANLDLFLTQSYHSFEVLVVDDYSQDNTQKVLLEYQKKYSYLRIINNTNIKKSNGKKAALTLGIQNAKNEILILSDADCRPASENWIKTSVEALCEKAVLLSYGPYFQEKGLLNAFIRYETAMTALQYFSFALMGLPYMGVGRNLCYRKSIFEKNGGFKSHETVNSGDDDLFINEVANGSNTAICVDYENFNYSEPKHTWSSFVRQKTRHLTTGKHYRWYHQLLLIAWAGSHAWHYFSGLVILLIFGNATLFFWGFGLRFLVMIFLIYLTLKKLRELSLMIYLPMLDALLAIYYAVAAPISLFIAKTKQWK